MAFFKKLVQALSGLTDRAPDVATGIEIEDDQGEEPSRLGEFRTRLKAAYNADQSMCLSCGRRTGGRCPWRGEVKRHQNLRRGKGMAGRVLIVATCPSYCREMVRKPLVIGIAQPRSKGEEPGRGAQARKWPAPNLHW